MTGDGWFLVVQPYEVGDFCGGCGQKFGKGDEAQRIHGGYGWRRRACCGQMTANSPPAAPQP